MAVYGRQLKFADYDGFVEKFKPKKTTDDCMTPPAVYEAVKDWAAREYGLEGREVVRPFWPGGDYEMFDYPDGCVVIDNQPFSMTAGIVRFYNENHIDYFLFAPNLTVFNADANSIICKCEIVYENGAKIPTSFVTNLGEYRVDTAPRLQLAVREAQANAKAKAKPLPKYEWPEYTLRSTELDAATSAGIRFTLRANECVFVRAVGGKQVFGGAYLIAKAKAKAVKIKLSPSELESVQALG